MSESGHPSYADSPVAVDDLHALVDGHLPDDRRAAVLAFLAARPDEARRVADWAAQRQALRALAADLALGPEPPAMRRALQPPGPADRPSPARGDAALDGRRRVWPAQTAVVLMAVAAGASGGWFAGRAAPLPTPSLASAPRFVGEATTAHAVFTPERRHPVEVTASDGEHLVRWLSRRLGVPVRTPDLDPHGWRLLGGRLLPGTPTPRAQFMYEDDRSRRLTLFVTVFPPGDGTPEVAFRSQRHGSVESFYWIEDGLGYALSGELPADELQRLARSVHRQLHPG